MIMLFFKGNEIVSGISTKTDYINSYNTDMSTKSNQSNNTTGPTYKEYNKLS